MDKDTIKTEMISSASRRLECYDKLIALAEEQKQLLIKQRHPDLAPNIAKFDPLLIQLKQIDDQEEAVHQYLERKQMGNLTDSAELGAEYGKIARAVEERAARLHTLTETNRQLLATKKEFTDFSISLICKIAAEQIPNSACSNPAIVLDSRV